MTFTRRTFRALEVPNFRRYAAGMLITTLGHWMQTVGLAWLIVHELGGGGVELGIATSLQFLPILLGSAFAGVLIDRWDKRRTITLTQLALAVVGAGLAVVTIAGVVEMWMVYAFSLLHGCAFAVDVPARQSFVSEVVGPDHLTNAIGLNSAMFNSARTIGPAIAGVVIAVSGTGACFALRAVAGIGVISSLSRMNADELRPSIPVPRARRQLREGFRYAWENRPVREPLVLLGLVAFVAYNFHVTVPLFASDTFHGDSSTLAMFSSALGAGSLVGALFTAGRVRPTPSLLVRGALAFTVVELALAASPTRLSSVVLLFALGGASMMFTSTANALVQLNTAPQMRGRVMAIYVTVFVGSVPIASPVIGWVCERWDTRVAFATGGAVGLAITLIGAARMLRDHSGATTVVADPSLAAI